MSQLYVKVKTGQNEFSIDTSGTYPVVAVEAEAEQGRANAELTARLSERLDTDVGIVSGHTSSRKKIAVDMEKDDALAMLS